jgi:hypothetical protein
MPEVDNIMRLASLLAQARVRRYAVTIGRAPRETEDGTNKRVEKAEAELRAAVENAISNKRS